ncbi:MAG TPA: cytochrome P450/oxidoreductase [Ottowia sp.]|uniref:cytochrome P450/oxidoreductase n=1 Tax=Ottowia sp. TaxID=1898956 RepID=UPI002D092E08|nr:cytochrome P450/oxidoreductase [Ottowia sp.]HMN22388.1 cytochrome P450/oxidoreductase [Ottowia sp.]
MTRTDTPQCPATQAPADSHADNCPFSAQAAAFDPFTDAYIEDPAELVRWAREQMPVFYSPKIDYWVVTRHQAIKDIFRDPHTFSPSNALESLAPPSDEATAVLKSYDYGMSRTLVNEDEPMHMARRRALMQPFTPDHLRQHEPLVRKIVSEAIDSFIDAGEVDLFKALTWHVPFTVALHFLGIDDEEDRERMHEFAVAHTKNAFGRPTPEERIEVAHTVGKFWQLSGEILAKMRRTPEGPGWMRYSIRQQKHHPEVVTDSYLHSMMMAIIVAAHESTSFATTNAIKTLLEHREIWNELREDPALISPAIEECLRYNGPIASWRRRALRDVEIEGVQIPAGARLLLVVASGNRDEQVFDEPELLDIRRSNMIDHLSFGYGVHQCLGKNIARMEMQIMIGELARRLPHMRLAPQEFKYVHNLAFRGPQNLFVQWDPAQNPERKDPGVRKFHQAIRLGAPVSTSMTRRLEVVAVETLASGPDIIGIRLKSPTGAALPKWTPGAHVDIECGDTGLSRQYSLCGDLNDRQHWELAIQRDALSRGGSAWVHRYATPGAILRLRGPRNHFHMDEQASGPLLLIAGGIGITPIMAMAQRARELGRDYQLHYSASTRARAAYAGELQALHGERLHLHISDEGGRVDLAALLARPDDETQIHACGPETLLAALQAAVDQAGWRPDALRVEHFENKAPKLDPAHECAFEIELATAGLTLQVPADRTVLEVLHAANVDVQCDCEEGLCGSCEVGVLAGDLDHRDSVLTPAERKAGQRMMTCVSRARTGRLVLDL